ncbi:MAG: homocysteine S-methyltransferase family protein [Acidobacteriia bacterium]|nr:homocysteine S-methyltransferase family protein [Terriglobia bacterium]
MHTLIQQLVTQGPILTDGAWGTELQARGLEAGDCPDVWNLTHPERVEEVARAYVEAGSQIILTNTFRANRLALERHGLAQHLREINRLGVEISRRAAGGRARVFASLGPSGKLLMMGEVSEEELRTAYAEQAEALAEAGADALIFETMSDLAEAKVGLQATRATGLPVIVSMAFDSGKNHDRTMMGTTPEEAAAELSAAGADVIGANCGQGIESYAPLSKRLHNATALPIWIKPNAGLPELVEGRTHYKTTPEEFARQAPVLLAAGANFLGGCCGTNPKFIRALRLALGKGLEGSRQ